MKKKKRKYRTKALSALLVLLIFAAIWLLLSAIWAFTTWSNLQMEEIVYELTAPLTGTGNDMITGYKLRCMLPAGIAALLSAVVLFRLRKKHFYKKMAAIGVISALALILGCGIYTWVRLDVGGYLINRGKDSTYIEDNYADPKTTQITFPEQKRNLIYIFLESMEATYADTKNGGAFTENYIPELTTLAQDNEDFSGTSTKLNGGISLTGATWTMGAMFAQTSGLPLKIQLDTNGMSSQTQFFPGIETLGDILAENGYSQTLMLGSNATFGGRRLYFTEHGNYDMMDYEYAKEAGLIPSDYKVWWGYEDEKLFDFAKGRLNELGNKDLPFNFTMLTVDTHFPDGYVSDATDTTEFDGNQYAEVIHGSSKQVVEFVDWCKQQPWYENTTIVISGDHPTMDADFCNSVDSSYQRKVYTTYINSAVQPADPDKKRTYTTFDDFPTTLAALGCTIEGDRLGLGTNLFSDTETLTERDGIEEENLELRRNSEFMNKASAISSDVVKTREAISSLKAKIKVRRVSDDFLVFRVKGLKSLSKYADQIQYVYLQIRNGDQLILSSPILTRGKNGVYTANEPISRLEGYTDITYMLRVRTTDGGTIDLTDAESYTVKPYDGS